MDERKGQAVSWNAHNVWQANSENCFHSSKHVRYAIALSSIKGSGNVTEAAKRSMITSKLSNESLYLSNT